MQRRRSKQELNWVDPEGEEIKAHFALEIEDPIGGRTPDLDCIVLQALVSCNDLLERHPRSRVISYKKMIAPKLFERIERQLREAWGLELITLDFKIPKKR